eukprot:296510-Chlamydomonas_euryale.AAC.5
MALSFFLNILQLVSANAKFCCTHGGWEVGDGTRTEQAGMGMFGGIGCQPCTCINRHLAQIEQAGLAGWVGRLNL